MPQFNQYPAPVLPLTGNEQLLLAQTQSGSPVSVTATVSDLTPGLIAGLKNVLTANGQLLIGSAGNAPVAATLTGTANQIIVTNGAGSVSLSLPQSIDTNASVTFGSIVCTGALTVGGNITVNGTVTLSGETASSIPYLNGSKMLTSGSALQFDGVNLGVGVTMSGWSGRVAIQNISGALAGGNSQILDLYQNAYVDGAGAERYYASGYASVYEQNAGSHIFKSATSGAAGALISWINALTVDGSGNITSYANVNVSDYGPFSDNLSHPLGAVINGFYAIIITSAAGNAVIPVFSNGGTGIDYNFTALTPGSTTWQNGAGLTISWTIAGTGGDAITVNISGGTGLVSVQRTAGSQDYGATIQKIYG